MLSSGLLGIANPPGVLKDAQSGSTVSSTCSFGSLGSNPPDFGDLDLLKLAKFSLILSLSILSVNPLLQAISKMMTS